MALLLYFGGCASTENNAQHSAVGFRDQGPVWPQKPLSPRIMFLKVISGASDLGIKRSWFSKAVGAFLGRDERGASMLRPYGIFADSNRIYVADPGLSALHIFDLSSKKYLHVNKFDGKPLSSPVAVAADNDTIYVADSSLKKLLQFDKKGAFLREFAPPGTFLRPTGIALTGDKVYVADTLADEVLVFSKKDRSLLFRFGGKGVGQGEFNYPTHLFVDRNGFLYVTDSMNFRIQIFSLDGKFVSVFGKQGDGSGDLSKPKGVAVDSEGHIYVADAHFDNVQIFDRSGRLLLIFGNSGRKIGEMSLPSGVFIDGDDKVYVADSFNNRIHIFQYLKERN